MKWKKEVSSNKKVTKKRKNNNKLRINVAKTFIKISYYMKTFSKEHYYAIKA